MRPDAGAGAGAAFTSSTSDCPTALATSWVFLSASTSRSTSTRAADEETGSTLMARSIGRSHRGLNRVPHPGGTPRRRLPSREGGHQRLHLRFEPGHASSELGVRRLQPFDLAAEARYRG